MMKPSTERDYRRRIARVVEAILLDPGAPHTLESLAAVAHLSPFHFHRIYRAVTGESVVETVQRLRLAQAAQRLTDAAARVTAVAHDAGYNSPQAFARAFRSFTGVSPSEFKARQRSLASSLPTALTSPLATSWPTLWPTPLPAPSTAAPAGAALSPTTCETTPARAHTLPPVSALPSVEIAEIAPFDVLSLRHDGPIATIGQTFRTLYCMLRCDEHALVDQRVGICVRDPSTPERFSYRAAIAAEPYARFVLAKAGEVALAGKHSHTRLDAVMAGNANSNSNGNGNGNGNPNAQASKNANANAQPNEDPYTIEPFRVEGGLYAVHRLIGPYALISPTFRALYHGWLPNSGYLRDRRPALELYRQPLVAGMQRTCVTDLMIPIRKD